MNIESHKPPSVPFPTCSGPNAKADAVNIPTAIEAIPSYESWLRSREIALVTGTISRSTLNNEQRVLKRFLRHVFNTDSNSTESNIGSSISHVDRKDEAQEGQPINSKRPSQQVICYCHAPFTNPLPIVNTFLATLSGDGARATAKGVIKQFLALESPGFDTRKLDYLTQTPHHSRHPLVELAIESRIANPTYQVNHRLHLKRFLNFIAQERLGVPFHNVDMQDELGAFETYIRTKVVDSKYVETTLTGLLVVYGYDLAIEFNKRHPEYCCKQMLSIVNQFLRFIDELRRGSSSYLEASRPQKARRILTTREPLLPVQSIRPAPQKKPIVIPPLSRERIASIEASFIKDAKGLVAEHDLSLQRFGFEIQIAFAMRDLLMVSIFDTVNIADWKSKYPERLANMRFSDVIVQGAKAGLYVLNAEDEYICTNLPDSLGIQVQLYRRQLGGCHTFSRYINEAVNDPNMFFSISIHSPLTIVPIAPSEVKKVLETELGI